MRKLNKFLALALAVLMMAGCLVISTSAATTTTNDTSDYQGAIDFLAAIDVFKGYTGGESGANDPITRWQMALFIARTITGYTDDAMWAGNKSAYFTDVTAYAGAIDLVASLGIINGYGDGLFGPNDGIRYQDALTMIVRALKYDTTTMSYPWGYIIKALSLHVNDGLANMTNEKTLTRGEVAQLVDNYLSAPVWNADTKAVDVPYLTSIFGAASQNLILLGDDTFSANSIAKEGKVKFAVINDGKAGATTYEFDKSVFGSFDYISYIGYAFTVVTVNNGKAVASITLNPTTVVENMGGTTAANATILANDVANTITINKTVYEVVDSLSSAVKSNRILLYKEGTGKTDAVASIARGNVTADINNAVDAYFGITLQDIDNDGTYDVGFYAPYSFAWYLEQSTKDSTNNVTGTRLYYLVAEDIVKASATNKSYYVLANGNAITSTALSKITTATGAVLSGNDSLKSSIRITGTIANQEYMIYNFNKALLHLTVAVNVGNTDSTAVVQKVLTSSSSVVIGGVTYKVGIDGTLPGLTDATTTATGGFTATFGDVAKAGISTALTAGATDGSANAKVLKYNDRIIFVQSIKATTAKQNYVIVEIPQGYANNSKDEYAIASASGYVTVNALDSTGAEKAIVVAKINGITYSEYKMNQLYTLKNAKVDTDSFFEGIWLYAIDSTNADGSVNLVTTYTNLNGVIAVKADTTLSFAKIGSVMKSSLYYIGTTGKQLELTASTKYIIVGKNGYKVATGLPTASSTLGIVASDAATKMTLALDNNTIVIYNSAKDVEDIATWLTVGSTISTVTNSKYYVMMTRTADADHAPTALASWTNKTINNVTYYEYEIANVYDLAAQATVTIKITSKNYYSEADLLANLFPEAYGFYRDTAGKLQTLDGGAVSGTVYKVTYADDAATIIAGSTMAAFAADNGYLAGVLTLNGTKISEANGTTASTASFVAAKTGYLRITNTDKKGSSVGEIDGIVNSFKFIYIQSSSADKKDDTWYAAVTTGPNVNNGSNLSWRLETYTALSGLDVYYTVDANGSVFFYLNMAD